MDIFTYIQNDHMNARKAIIHINLIADGDHSRRIAQFRRLKEELIAHSEAEESTFYKALRQHEETRKAAYHSKKQHNEMTRMLQELDNSSIAPGVWREKFALFQRTLLFHIADEEGEIFAKARPFISGTLSAELANQMDTLKQLREQLHKHHAA